LTNTDLIIFISKKDERFYFFIDKKIFTVNMQICLFGMYKLINVQKYFLLIFNPFVLSFDFVTPIILINVAKNKNNLEMC